MTGKIVDGKKVLESPSEEEVLQEAALTRHPYPFAKHTSKLSKPEQITQIALHFQKIMEILGLDIDDPSLSRTPYRVAKMYVEEVFSGLDLEQFPAMTFIDDCFSQDSQANMVFVKVSFVSFCEHHFVPMEGTAYVAYVPNGKIIGLSKIPRLVRFFASRPQLQERLTAQVADSLCNLLGTETVAVSISAKHFCVLARGIEDTDSVTVTNVLRGEFNQKEMLRREFFEAVNRV